MRKMKGKKAETYRWIGRRMTGRRMIEMDWIEVSSTEMRWVERRAERRVEMRLRTVFTLVRVGRAGIEVECLPFT